MANSTANSMCTFAQKVLQCRLHLTSVEKGHEHHGGWQDVFGGACFAVPRGVWRRHTKREAERALKNMIQQILEKIPGEESTAQTLASCFMRFTWDPSHFTVENMEEAMDRFLDNLAELKKHEALIVAFIINTYGSNNIRAYTVGGGAIPRIPVLFDEPTVAEHAGGGSSVFEQGKLYDLYKIVHPSDPSLVLANKPEGFTIRRDIMLFWWQARTEYATYVRDRTILSAMVEDGEVLRHVGGGDEDFDRISPISMVAHTFSPTFVDSANRQLMRQRLLSFASDARENISPATSPATSPVAPPTVVRPNKRQRREEEEANTQRCFRLRTLYK